MPSAGEQMFLGIQLTMDSSGVVTGASLAKGAMGGVAMEATKAQQSVTNSANMMAESMKLAAGLAAGGAAAIGLAGKLEDKFLTPAIEQTKSFQVAMEQLRFVANATEEEFKQLESTAIETGLKTKFAPQEAVDAMRMLLSTGMEMTDMYESLDPVLQLVTASMGKLSLERGAEAVAGMIAKFRHDATGAAEVTDTWANATRLTNLQMRELPIVMKGLRDAPGVLKAKLHETLAVVGILRSQLTSAQAAQTYAALPRRMAIVQAQVDKYLKKTGQSMVEFLERPQKKMPEVVGAFQKFGTAFFDPITGKMKNSIDLIASFAETGKTISKASEKDFTVASQKLFGSQFKATLSAINSYERFGKTGSEAFRALSEELAGSAGAAKEAEQAYLETAQGLEELIAGTKDTIAIITGKALMGPMHVFHGLVKAVLDTFLKFIEANPAFTQAMGATLGIMIILLKVAGSLAIAMAAVVLWTKVMVPSFLAMAGSAGIASMMIGALSAVMKGLLVVGGSLLLIFGTIYLAMTLWEKIWDKDAKGIFKTIQTILTDVKLVFTAFFDWFDGKSDDVDLFQAVNDRGLTGTVITLLQIKERIVAVLDGIWSAVTTAFSPVIYFFTEMSEVIGAGVDNLYEWFGIIQSESIEDEIPKWKVFGQILGTIAMVIIPIFIVKLGIMTLRTIAQTVAQVALNLALAVAMVKFILIGAAIAVLIAAYIAVIGLAMRFGKWLGTDFPDIIGNLLGELNIFKERFFQWGGDLATKFIEGFKGNWQPFFDAIEESWNYLKTLWKNFWGDASDIEVEMAMPKSMNMRKSKEEALRKEGQHLALGSTGTGYVEREQRREDQAGKKMEKAIKMYQQSNPSNINIQTIEVATEGMSDQDALKATRNILKKMAEAKDNEAEVSFGTEEAEWGALD